MYFRIIKSFTLWWILWGVFASGLSGQVIVSPSVKSKTHPSLQIDSIYTGNETVVFLHIVNENTEGNAWFCADKNIDLVDVQTNQKYPLRKQTGIPVCPETHTFKKFGEKLYFRLYFPALDPHVDEIDIIEACSDNCFSLKGIVLNQQLNQEIRQFEKGVELFTSGKYQDALIVFKELAENSGFKSTSHFAYATYILPVIYHQVKEEEKAKEAYQKLVHSTIREKAYFLRKIHEIPFFSELRYP